jgi:hypothetical protein
MSKKYWVYDGAAPTTHWDEQNGGATYVHWRDASPTGAVASALPTTDDEVYLTGATAPTTGPGSAITFTVFDSSALTAAALVAAVTQNITIKAAGKLYMAAIGETGRAHVWKGTASASGIAILLCGACENQGTLGANASFNDSAVNKAGATVGANATFNGNTVNESTGTVGASAVFNGNAVNAGTVGNYATFNGSAYNSSTGTVGTNATFNDTAVNLGTAGVDALFNGEAVQKGIVGDRCRLKSSGVHYGSWNNTVFLMANTTLSQTEAQNFQAPTTIVFTDPSFSLQHPKTTAGNIVMV